MDSIIPETEIRIPVKFAINSDKAADWYIDQQRRLDDEIAVITAQAGKMIADLRADKERLHGLYQAELEHYVAGLIEANKGKKKTIHFLHGSCSFRTVPASVRISDEEAALQWAIEDAPALVATVQKLDTAGLRKLAEEYLQANGDLIPGVEVVEERQSFSIKFGGGKGE